MFFDPELYNTLDKPWLSIVEFLHKTLPSLGFTSQGPEVVMDVGCGPGYLSKNYILPCFPNLQQMIAVDVTPGMVQEAKAKHSHPKIEYLEADIEDRSTLENWKGKITKLTAIHSFNWLRDQKKGFEIVFGLLKPGGEAAFVFSLNGAYYDGLLLTANDPRFSIYLENADYCVPDSYYQRYDSSHYRKMLTDIGFKVILCTSETKKDILSSDEEFRDIFYSVCPLVKYLPVFLRGDFKEQLFQNILKCNGRSEDGRPIYRGTMLEVLVRKEE